MREIDDALTRDIIGAAIFVSKKWGNGLLESVYLDSLAHELTKRHFDVRKQVAIPGVYDDLIFATTFRADLIVNGLVTIEVKAVSATLPVHRSQLRTYMRLCGTRTGLLFNFHAYPFTKGIIRLEMG